MITDTDVFVCPFDHRALEWPAASCPQCGRGYLLETVDTELIPEGKLAAYDFRPTLGPVGQDRLDLPAHLKIIEGLTSFEPRKLADLGFSLEPATLAASDAQNSGRLAGRLWHLRSLEGVVRTYAKHALLGGYSHKVGPPGDSVDSSFRGYSTAYEMLSDFARPRPLVRRGQFVVDGAIKHHYDNMRSLATVLRQWKAESVLEFGCGTGINLILLARTFQWDWPISFSGFDYPLSRFLSAAANLSLHDVSVANLFVADGRALPLADESVDVVFSHYVIEQMAGFEKSALENMLRVAKKGVVLFETAVLPELDWNQKVFMKHSGYSRSLPEVLRRTSHGAAVETRVIKTSYLYGCPNVMFVVPRRQV